MAKLKSLFQKLSIPILLLYLSCVLSFPYNIQSIGPDSDGAPTTQSSATPAVLDSKFNKYKESLTQSFLMILFSEIGDKTFLIAAILAMKHSRMLIFVSSCSALWLMSLLSALVGNVLISFVPQRYVSLAASFTFIVFAVKMFFEARQIKDDEIIDEMESIQNELVEANLLATNSSKIGSEKSPEPSDLSFQLETGSIASAEKSDFNVQIDSLDYSAAFEASPANSAANTDSSNQLKTLTDSIKNLFSFLLSPIFVQVFALMFLAEWGDRSQIATIALGASNEVWCVTVGTIVGHTICTGLAVLCGRFLAERISVRLLTFVGCFLFLIFGVLYFYEYYNY
ncbi:GDT1-like protein C17G8.08c [Smittium mucronatum]|uniref:GDT1 family protein n=1 Tax=Smittium mucronatum TaxID=133383 RepID=A0A1R0H115_9FUNG|nr:GDT1-like protein C17G8.08c [Smittium mucronatum]